MKQHMRTLALSPLIVLALLLLAFASPVTASAASVNGPLHASRTRHDAQLHGALRTSNLTYHNGPVMVGTSHIYAIFWEPTGSYVSSTYNSLILRYFGDIGGSSLYHISTQYTQTGGGYPSNATLAASWVDTGAYTSNTGTLSDAQIQGEVTHAQQINGWTSNIDNIFFVFTAKGENICAGSSCRFTTFCAYHSNFGNNSIYASMPYTGTNLSACGVSTSPNNDFDADSTINVTSHEEIEAATDPLGNAWYDRSGSEIGDKCAWNFGPTNTQGGDVTWNGHTYEVQKEWDNLIKGCALTGP